MRHKILRPFIVKVSVLSYFPIIKIKRNSMHNIVNQLNVYQNNKNNLILITINRYILIIATRMLFLLNTPLNYPNTDPI